MESGLELGLLLVVRGFCILSFDYCAYVYLERGCFVVNVTLSEVPLGPPDAIFKVSAAYQADTDPRKVNLGKLAPPVVLMA